MNQQKTRSHFLGQKHLTLTTIPGSKTSAKGKDIEVSVIIPSHNKFPQNLLTLYSLENQSFDPAKTEVVMIDDASGDATVSIPDKFQFPFLFKYIRSSQNLGRPKARNAAVKAAEGEILMFLDAEVIVEPDWIQNHLAYHQNNNRMVVSGVMVLKGVYTLLFPDFQADQRNHVRQLIKEEPELLSKWDQFEKHAALTQIFFKQDIITQSYKKLSFEKPYMQKEVLQHFGDGLEGFHLSWLAFLTGNVSIRKEFLEKAGPFNETFKLFGWEDGEIGYRLYKLGGKFVNNSKDISYHQEHPAPANKYKETLINFNIMQQMHPEVPMLVLSLIHLPPGKSLLKVNKIYDEYVHLCRRHPKHYVAFKQAFKQLLQQISPFVAKGQKISGLPQAAGIKHDQQMIRQINELKKEKQYPNLTSVFEAMMKT